MIVDIHTHTFPDSIAAATITKLQAASRTQPFTDGTNGGLRASMTACGVDCSVLLPVATNPEKVSSMNDRAARGNLNWQKSGLYTLGCIHPLMDHPRRELKRIAALGLKGVKIHPAYQHTYFDDPRYLDILDACGELDLVVLAHAGIDIGLPEPVFCTPPMIRRALDSVGPVKLILAHMGGWRQWDEVEDTLTGCNVYLDTSFSLGSITPLPGVSMPREELELMGQEQFLRFVRAFGPQRLLFGTDSPWGNQAADLARLQALPLSAQEKEAILGGNAVRLLQLQDA